MQPQEHQTLAAVVVVALIPAVLHNQHLVVDREL
jgi:hypothetical protein